MTVNINIGIDNSQLYRVNAVFVIAIVMQDNVDNKTGNELTHLRAEFLN